MTTETTFSAVTFIDGIAYTPEQIHAAVRAAWLLALAYAKSDPANGGGESVEWEDVNEAHTAALNAFAGSSEQELQSQAKSQNGIAETSDCALNLCDPAGPHEAGCYLTKPPVSERKKADDTEGGACD